MKRKITRKQKKIEIKDIKKATPFLVLSLILIISFLYLINKNSTDDEISQEHEENQEFLINESLLPIRNWEIDAPTIEARSGVVAHIDSEGNKKFVFEKNKDLKLPIASITKLVTALVILENYNLEKIIVISEDFFNRKDLNHDFFPKEEYKIKDLMHPLLMESNNSVAYLLAEEIGQTKFINLMNQKASNLGMTNTHFVNPSGLDPSNISSSTNYSTAKDLVILMKYLIDKPLIFEILSLLEYDLVRQDGFFKYTVKNTNFLLNEMPKIIGGKTGTTARAQQCLTLVIEEDNEYIISVILGSRDRFNETKKIIEWSKSAYYWKINEWL